MHIHLISPTSSSGLKSGLRRFAARAGVLVVTSLCLAAGALAAETPTVTLTPPNPNVQAGQVVTLTATVQAGSVNVTRGTVQLCDTSAPACVGLGLIGEAQVVGGGNAVGTATFRFRPPPGTHHYKAMFLGTPRAVWTPIYNPNASSPVTVTVAGAAAATTTLDEPSGSIGNYSLTAHVSARGPNQPTGNVSFQDTSNQNYQLKSAALGAATGTLSFPDLPSSSPDVGADSLQVALGDFYEDGIQDIATGDAGRTVTFLRGMPDGSFTKLGSKSLSYCCAYALVLRDLNGDGHLDLLVSGDGAGNLIGDVGVQVYIGNGNGTFQDTAIWTPTDVMGRDIAVGDFNGDGVLDLALGSEWIPGKSNLGVPAMQTLMGLGGGRFTKQPLDYGDDGIGHLAPQWPGALITADFDRNGTLDLGSAGSDGSFYIALGNGNGSFAKPVPVIDSHRNIQPGRLTAGDFDGDGLVDLAAAVQFAWTVTYLKGDGHGGFAWKGNGPFLDHITGGDFNGDGRQDIAISTSSRVGGSSLLLNQGNWQFIRKIVPVSDTGQAPSIRTGYQGVGDFNGDGLSDIAMSQYTPNMWVYLTDYTWAADATATGISIVGTANHAVKAHYEGNAFYAPSDSGTKELNAAKLDTTLTVSPDPVGSSPVGQTVTLKATLGIKDNKDAQGHAPANELVTFMAGNRRLGQKPLLLVERQYVATLPTTELPPGNITITATYEGDSNFNSSSGSTPYTVVAPQVTTVGLTVSTGLPNVGQKVVLTARVTSGGVGLQRGTVNFCHERATPTLCTDINRLGTAQIVNGTATLAIMPPTGTYNYRAEFMGTFVGTQQYAASRSDPKLVVVRGLYGSQTNLTNASGIYTARVSGFISPDEGLLPTGPVSIVDTSNTDSLTPLAVVQLPSTAVNALSVTTTAPGTGPAPYSVVAGDFDQDGIEDFAAADKGDKTVVVYFGQANGTFGRKQTLNTSDVPFPIVAGDFDNNHTLDIAIGNGTNITVFPGNGNGTFGNAVSSPASDFADLVVGDFDRDGTLDLAVVHTSNLQIYHGVGNNHFSPVGNPTPPGISVPPVADGHNPSSAAGDFSNDGILDLIVPDGGWNGHVWVLLGIGDGTFEPSPTRIPVGAAYVGTTTAADFDGDLKLDFAVGVAVWSDKSSVLVFKGMGDGKNFQQMASTKHAAHAEIFVTPAVGDFNADGVADLAMADYWATYLFSSADVQIWIGDGNWKFSSALLFSPSGRPLSTIVGDFNGDGFTDVAVANAASDSVTAGFVRPTAEVTATLSNVPVPVGDPAKGAHQLVASYPGDRYFRDSKSDPATPVTPQKLTLTFTLKPDPQQVGSQIDPVTLTATVAPNGNAQGHTTDGVEIDFYANDNLLGTGKLRGGTASYTTQPYQLNSGPNTVKAVYKGSSTANPYFVIPADATNTVNVGVRKP